MYFKSLATHPYPAAMRNGHDAWTQAIWPGPAGLPTNWTQFSVSRVGAAPPPPPVNAGATTGAVNVLWSNVAGATSYNVKRADTPSGPFLTVAYFRTGNNYTDIAPMVGTGRTYYYRVTSNVAVGESPDSASSSIAHKLAKQRAVPCTARDVIAAPKLTKKPPHCDLAMRRVCGWRPF